LETSLDEALSPALAAPEEAIEPVGPEPLPVRWALWNRIAFRIAFLYFFIFMFMYGNGSIFSVFPVVGDFFDQWMTWPLQQVALWVGHRFFHLTGWVGTFHPTGSGDTAMDWVLELVFVAAALGGGLLWTLIAAVRGNRRAEYGTLYAWLRFGVRLTVGFFMVNYGFAKLYPLQMAPISIGILNEPVGQMSPMTFLWAMLGLNPGYEMICGGAEVLGGVMILFRRTALAGALLSAFVMTNVLLYNMFFDVPVKLFAANLLLAELFIILPDVRPLFDFFWLHKPSAPAGIWIPPIKRKGFRIATKVIEIALSCWLVIALAYYDGMGWKRIHAAAHEKSPLLGAWHLDAAHPATGPFITNEGLPTTDFYIDTTARAFRRSTDLTLWRTGIEIDAKADTMTVYTNGAVATYAINLPDPNHLILVTKPPKVDPRAKPDAKAKPFVAETVSFTREPLPAHYPLLERGFHWVNEWGLER
jgi:hypothetical protein